MNRGFTLVELLAVIIIILTITIITTFAVSSIVSTSKQKIGDVQAKIIEDATGMWIVDNIDKFASDNICLYITFNELYEYGYIDDAMLIKYFDELNDKEIENIKVKIDLKNDKKYDITITDTLTNCNHAYE